MLHKYLLNGIKMMLFRFSVVPSGHALQLRNRAVLQGGFKKSAKGARTAESAQFPGKRGRDARTQRSALLLAVSLVRLSVLAFVVLAVGSCSKSSTEST